MPPTRRLGFVWSFVSTLTVIAHAACGGSDSSEPVGTTGSGGAATGGGGASSAGAAGIGGKASVGGAGAPQGGTSGSSGVSGAGEAGSGTAGASGGAGEAGSPNGGAAGVSGGAGAALPGGPRATWLWGSSVVKSPSDTAGFFSFAASHAITGVYAESQSLLSSAPASLASFIATAKTHGIEVELLFGYELWARASEHAKAVALAESAAAFSAGLSGPKPIGVHFDVEPHQLPEWKAGGASEAQIAAEFVELLEKLHAVTQGAGLRLSVDIPFWYDGRPLTRGGVTRPLSEWVADSVDRVVLMDYRDTADGPDGIVAQAANEIAYGATIGKPVVLGVETLCNLDPPKVTFCEEGAAVLEAELAKTIAVLSESAGFAGLAVHDYKAYAALKP